MALYNLARVSTATIGIGTITLGPAVSGFLTFALAGVPDGAVVSYGIRDGDESEVGRGTYTALGTTLSRDTVLNSTNGGAKIVLSGTAEVFITALKEDFHDAVTLGTASGLSLAGQILSLGLASAGVTGALSGADWITFNNKQNALSFPLSPSLGGTGVNNGVNNLTVPAPGTAALLGVANVFTLLNTFNNAINLKAITPTTGAGDLYNDSGQEKHGAFTNGIAGWFEKCIWSAYAEVTYNGVTTAQSMFTGTAKGTRTLPANFWKQGKALRVRVQGHYSTDAVPGNAQIDIKFGSTTFRTTGSFALDLNITEGFWNLEFAVVCQTTGMTGTLNGTVSWNHAESTAGGVQPVISEPFTTHTPVTIDTTAAATFDILWTATDSGTMFHVDSARIFEEC